MRITITPDLPGETLAGHVKESLDGLTGYVVIYRRPIQTPQGPGMDVSMKVNGLTLQEVREMLFQADDMVHAKLLQQTQKAPQRTIAMLGD